MNYFEQLVVSEILRNGPASSMKDLADRMGYHYVPLREEMRRLLERRNTLVPHGRYGFDVNRDLILAQLVLVMR